MDYHSHCLEIKRCLDELVVDMEGKKSIPAPRGFEWLVKESKAVRSKRKQVFFVGNGASASMASHMALDMWKNLRIHAMAFNDLVSLTATSNDYSYEEVFTKPLNFFSRRGDILVCISSSGNSPNILDTATMAKKKGLKIVTFSAMSPQNKLRKLGKVNFYVPATTYGLAETAHQALLHYWVDCLLARE